MSIRNTLKLATLFAAFFVMFAAAPQAANAQVYTCATTDRACLIETINYLQSIIATCNSAVYNQYYTPVTTGNQYQFTSFTSDQDSEINRLWNLHDDITDDTIAFEDGYDTDEVADLLDEAADALFDAGGWRRNSTRTTAFARGG